MILCVYTMHHHQSNIGQSELYPLENKNTPLTNQAPDQAPPKSAGVSMISSLISLLASTAAEPPLALLKELPFKEDDFYSMTTEYLAREQDRLYNFEYQQCFAEFSDDVEMAPDVEQYVPWYLDCNKVGHTLWYLDCNKAGHLPWVD